MRKLVFTIKEDVCVANGKDVTASDLLAVMTKYGTVEEYDRVVAGISAEYQASIDGLNRQLEIIRDQELTDDEIKMVKAYRDCKNNVVGKYVAVAEEYAKQLEAVKQEAEQRTARIKAILGE